MNRDDRFIIVCDCGCDEGFVFHRTEDAMFIGAFASCFYAARPSFAREARINYFKDGSILAGIVTTRDELQELRDWLASSNLKESDWKLPENQVVLEPAVLVEWDVWELNLRMMDGVKRSEKPCAYADVFDFALDQEGVDELVKTFDEVLHAIVVEDDEQVL